MEEHRDEEEGERRDSTPRTHSEFDELKTNNIQKRAFLIIRLRVRGFDGRRDTLIFHGLRYDLGWDGMDIWCIWIWIWTWGNWCRNEVRVEIRDEVEWSHE